MDTPAIKTNVTVADVTFALDSYDMPHIVYLDKDTKSIMYSQWPDQGFTKVADGDFIRDRRDQYYFPITIALNQNDQPYICYYSHQGLQCSWKNEDSWESSLVGPNGINPSLAIDRYGNLHLAYYDFLDKDLLYAFLDRNKGNGWQKYLVDGIDSVGQYPSMTLDANGIAHISYYDETNANLKYAIGRDGGWSLYTIDTEGDVGTFSSLCVDTNGNPHISYYDSTNHRLKYVYGRIK